MSKSKKGLLPSIEILIILVFFLSFIIWAVSKCKNTQLSFDQEEQTDTTPDGETDVLDSLALEQFKPQPLPQKETAPIATTPNSGTAKGTQSLSRLYVVINNLNMRTGPTLDSSIVEQLPLFEEVYYLNQVTDSTSRINLGKEIVEEPWVKIQSKRGKQGWVFGAGVNYYRKKHPGAE